jgi:hypothetical protein
MDEGINPKHVKQAGMSKNNYLFSLILMGASIIWVFSLLSIFVLKAYGLGLFLGVPLVAGSYACYLATVKHNISGLQSFYVAFGVFFVASVGFVVFAIEGVICLIMAIPFEIIVAIFAGGIGHSLGKVKNENRKARGAVLFVPMFLFAGAFFDSQPTTYSVVTSVEIDAPPSAVWKNVVEFSKIPEPTEFIFKTGIAYPINAKIDGQGVGAIRHCNFTTGSFVEPITVWDEPKLLAFDVLEQPEPMKELSPYNIDPTHLHGYFQSERGQFKLTDLGNGKTLLEGTTWYHHKVSPEFYWHFWSDMIIHAIHDRVLNCVKAETEKQVKQNS